MVVLDAPTSATSTPACCCFCRLPADNSVPCGLAGLIPAEPAPAGGGGATPSGAVPLMYHEACAAYAASIAFGRVVAKGRPREPFRHGTIPAVKVQHEWLRAASITCSICQQRGASLHCKGIHECGCVWHLPCAREAAQSSGSVVFASTVIEAACRQHAHMVAEPLQEPCGMWFESEGGWDNHEAAASAAWKQAQQQQQQIELPEGKHKHAGQQRAVQAAAAAAGEGLPWVEHDGVVHILDSDEEEEERQLAVQPPQPPEQLDPPRQGSVGEQHSGQGGDSTAAAPAPSQQAAGTPVPASNDGMEEEEEEEEKGKGAGEAEADEQEEEEDEVDDSVPYDSWRIPGHTWITRGDIDGAPPHGQGDLLVLSHVIPRAYRETYDRVTSAYMQRMADSPRDYPAVVVASDSQALTTNLTKYIKRNKGLRLHSPGQLPQHVPVARGERFKIPADDPRRDLAADSSSLGLRCPRGTRRSHGVPKDTVLGAYQCIQLLQPHYQRLLEDDKLAVQMGLDPDQLAACFEAYAADSSVGASTSFFNSRVAVAQPLLEELDLHENYHFTYSAFGFGNKTALINDVAIQPLKDINAGKRPEEMAIMGEANCDFVEALVLGWPHLFVVTAKDVAPGEEFLLNYGRGYWEAIATEKRRCKMSKKQKRNLRSMWEAQQAQLMQAADPDVAAAGSGCSPSGAQQVEGMAPMETQASAARTGSGGCKGGSTTLAAAPVTAPPAVHRQPQQQQKQKQQQQDARVAEAGADLTAPPHAASNSQALAAGSGPVEGCDTSPGPRTALQIPRVRVTAAAAAVEPAGGQQLTRPVSSADGCRRSAGHSFRSNGRPRLQESSSRSRSRRRSRSRSRRHSRSRSRRRSRSRGRRRSRSRSRRRSKSRGRQHSRSRGRRRSRSMSRSRRRSRSRSRQLQRLPSLAARFSRADDGGLEEEPKRRSAGSRGRMPERLVMQPAAMPTSRLQQARSYLEQQPAGKGATQQLDSHLGERMLQSHSQRLPHIGSNMPNAEPASAVVDPAQQQPRGPTPDLLEPERSGTPDLEELAQGLVPPVAGGALAAPMSRLICGQPRPPSSWMQTVPAVHIAPQRPVSCRVQSNLHPSMQRREPVAGAQVAGPGDSSATVRPTVLRPPLPEPQPVGQPGSMWNRYGAARGLSRR